MERLSSLVSRPGANSSSVSCGDSVLLQCACTGFFRATTGGRRVAAEQNEDICRVSCSQIFPETFRLYLNQLTRTANVQSVPAYRFGVCTCVCVRIYSFVIPVLLLQKCTAVLHYSAYPLDVSGVVQCLVWSSRSYWDFNSWKQMYQCARFQCLRAMERFGCGRQTYARRVGAYVRITDEFFFFSLNFILRMIFDLFS